MNITLLCNCKSTENEKISNKNARIQVSTIFLYPFVVGVKCKSTTDSIFYKLVLDRL